MSVEAATTAAAAASATEIVKLLAALSKPPEPNPYIPALIGLGGVLVGALIQIGGQEIAAWRHRRDERRKATKASILAALRLSRHLEAYASQMLDVIVSWNSVDWYEPYKWHCDWDAKPLYVQPLTDWPENIKWEDLPSETVVEVENFRDQTTTERSILSGWCAHLTGKEAHRVHADSAAMLAPLAWDLAQRIRSVHNIAPVQMRDGYDKMRLSREHKKAQQKYEASMKATTEEMDAL